MGGHFSSTTYTGKPDKGISSDLSRGLSELIDLHTLQKIQDDFADTFDFPTLVYDTSGSPITQPSRFTEFFDVVNSTETGKRKCTLYLTELFNAISLIRKPVIRKDWLLPGLVACAVPITINGVLVAWFYFGQLTMKIPDNLEILKLARETGIDERKLLLAAETLIPVSEKIIDTGIFTLKLIAENVAHKVVQQKISGGLFSSGGERNFMTTVQRLATVIEQAAQVIVITDLEGKIEYVNPAFEKSTGYSFSEAIGRNPRILKSGEQDEMFYSKLWKTISSGRTWEGIFVNKRKDDSFYHEKAVIFPIKNGSGEIINYAAVKQDISMEKKLESQLRQAVKMEVIASLSSGIAHDFNNLLTAITGFAEMALLDVNEGKLPRKKDLTAILEAGKRAGILTSKLLILGKKQIYRPEPLDINEVILSMETFLRRSISNDIYLKIIPRDGLPKITADRHQLEQILVNLVSNASYAVQMSGNTKKEKRIVLETGMETFSPFGEKNKSGIKEGVYIFFSVADNGIGMDFETKEKIFDPFFTTKEKASNAGLGLSLVYGIVSQNKGTIQIHSKPGKGSEFRIYWPVSP